MGTRDVEFLGRGYVRPGARGAFRTASPPSGSSPDFNTLILIGQSDNGYDANDSNLEYSKRVMEFGSTEESRSLLSSGDIADAIENAFSPSRDSRFSSGPILIKAICVNPNVAAEAEVEATGYKVKAVIPGPKGNQIRFRISGGGTIIQIGDANNIQTSTALESRELEIEYSGDAASAGLLFDGTNFSVTLPTGTGASTDGSTSFSANIKDYTTLFALSEYINSKLGFTCRILSQPDRKTNTLDHIIASDSLEIKGSPKVLHSLLTQQERYFRGQGLAEIVAGPIRKPLADMVSFKYLSGGATGVPSVTNWLDAIDLVFDTEVAKGFYINVCTDLEVVRLYLADKLARSNSPEGSDERFGGAGLDTTKTVDERIDDIKNTNSEFLTLGFSPVMTRMADRITDKTYSGWMIAVIHNAIKAAANIRETPTNKDLNIKDSPEKLTKPQIGKVIRAGGLIVTRKANNGPFRIEFALTSYQAENLILNQTSTVCTALAIVKDLREWLDSTLVGEVPTDPSAIGSNLTDADIRTALVQRFRYVYIASRGWLTRNIYNSAPAFDENFTIRADGDVRYFIFPDGTIVSPLNFLFFLLGLDVVRGTSTSSQ
ncbi:hypothetical protein [Leptospira licerasiae]|uniref:Phage tail protein n=1 Tax=Leptospira licerasiae str. MMD4847 TaxID=1049971 RepID=A0ABP2RCZ9_9LEPT|nr:hypothetical protein [Leptospira licerasiae]EIE01500.1 hypothetical protein LEP1GSC185_3939 [Leptospira licerasiae serovar Varillal str. VAR 010]EJZ42310.1 hypothetical protein LEP1GSC178_0008 [Leptospira licerasiae str. MMD4847]